MFQEGIRNRVAGQEEGHMASASRTQPTSPRRSRALAIRQKALPADDPDLATSFKNLGGLCAQLGRYGEAEQLYKQSLAILEKAFGGEHPYVATNLNNLAAVCVFNCGAGPKH